MQPGLRLFRLLQLTWMSSESTELGSCQSAAAAVALLLWRQCDAPTWRPIKLRDANAFTAELVQTSPIRVCNSFENEPTE